MRLCKSTSTKNHWKAVQRELFENVAFLFKDWQAVDSENEILENAATEFTASSWYLRMLSLTFWKRRGKVAVWKEYGYMWTDIDTLPTHGKMWDYEQFIDRRTNPSNEGWRQWNVFSVLNMENEFSVA